MAKKDKDGTLIWRCWGFVGIVAEQLDAEMAQARLLHRGRQDMKLR